MIFDRLIKQIGEDKLTLINSKTVAVIGLGGVGGHAVESLVRSGIENILIIDYDKIDETNLNRQIIALRSNVGELKTEMFKKRIADINPNCRVEVISEFINADNIDILSNYKIDYLVDACDSLLTKKLLIKYCQESNIKLIAAMGAGNKLDPSKLEITKLSKTSYDPLAKTLRKYIKDNRLKDVVVVASNEKPINTDGAIISSNSFVPATSGILLASYVINDIITNK